MIRDLKWGVEEIRTQLILDVFKYDNYIREPLIIGLRDDGLLNYKYLIIGK